jgi:hypothetical protein
MILSTVSKIDMCCRSWPLVHGVKYSIARADFSKVVPVRVVVNPQGEVLSIGLFAGEILLVYP